MRRNRAAVFSWIILWGIAVFPVFGQANPSFDWKTLRGELEGLCNGSIR